MNVLIVDDQKSCRNYLKLVIESHFEEFQIFEAHSGNVALKISELHQMDLIFLDIQLQESSGLKVAEHLRAQKGYEFIPIIFTSGHIEFMIKAFKEYKCFDFLEKPFGEDEVVSSISSFLRSPMCKKTEREKVEFKMGKSYLKLNPSEIYFVEVRGRNCKLYMKEDAYELPYTTLKELKEKLPSDLFVQSHKAFLVNVEEIQAINEISSISWEVAFKEIEQKALLGKRYKDAFLIK